MTSVFPKKVIHSARAGSVPTCAVVNQADAQSMYVVDQFLGIEKFRIPRDSQPNVPVGQEPKLVLDLSDVIAKTLSESPMPKMPFAEERGVLGMAFLTDEAYEHHAVVVYSAPFSHIKLKTKVMGNEGDTDHVTMVSVFHLNGGPELNRQTEVQLIAFRQPEFNHNGGAVAFHPDRANELWIALGDGGGQHDMHGKDFQGTKLGYAQDPDSPNGKIHRFSLELSVERDFHLTVPTDNPYGMKHTPGSMVALGLRNPWRMSFDAEGNLWIGDVGQSKREMVHVLRKKDQENMFRSKRAGAVNFGWRVYEGSLVHSKELADFFVPNFREPVAEYGHDEKALPKENSGVAIIGGAILNGEYVFADYRGVVFSIPAAFKGKQTHRVMHVFENTDIHTFGHDEDNLYVVGRTPAFGKSAEAVHTVIYRLDTIQDAGKKDAQQTKACQSAMETTATDKAFEVVGASKNAYTVKEEFEVVGASKKYHGPSSKIAYTMKDKQMARELFKRAGEVVKTLESAVLVDVTGRDRIAHPRVTVALWKLGTDNQMVATIGGTWELAHPTAAGKAYTAGGLSSLPPGSSFGNVTTTRMLGAAQKSGLLSGLAESLSGEGKFAVIKLPGGLPLFVNDVLWGGIGVSGDHENVDEVIALDIAGEKYAPPSALRKAIDYPEIPGSQTGEEKSVGNPRESVGEPVVVEDQEIEF